MPQRKAISLGRHRRNCSVCHHPERSEIEAEFIAWRSPAALAKQYGLSDRASIYRHARAHNLDTKRQRNLRAALARLIERVDDVPVTANAIVGAVMALARINASGEWVNQNEQVTAHDIFAQMSRAELEAYAQAGTLPERFSKTVDTDVLAGEASYE